MLAAAYGPPAPRPTLDARACPITRRSWSSLRGMGACARSLDVRSPIAAPHLQPLLIALLRHRRGRRRRLRRDDDDTDLAPATPAETSGSGTGAGALRPGRPSR